MRRVARRAEQLGYGLDVEEQAMPASEQPAMEPAVEQPVVEQPVVEQPVVGQPVVEPPPLVTLDVELSATEPTQGVRAAKRAREDALMSEYEASKMGRTEFAAGKGILLGTIDGMFARARKRRSPGPCGR